MQYKVEYCFDLNNLPQALTKQMNDMARMGWKVEFINTKDLQRAMVTYSKE